MAIETNKRVVYIALIICIVALIVSIILNCKGLLYGTNIAIGVFASSLLSLTVSLSNYYSIRRETLEKFSDNVWGFAKMINMYDVDASIDYKVNYLLDVYKTNYNELDQLYTMIALMLSNKKRDYIYNSLYHPIHLVRQELSRHNQDLIKYQNNSSVDIKEVINKIESTFLSSEDTPKSGKKFLGYTDNTIAVVLLNDLCGKYYKILYGKRMYNSFFGKDK